MPPGITVPASATGTIRPWRTFGAPETPDTTEFPTSTEITFNFVESGCGSQEIILPTTTFSRPSPTFSTPSSSATVIVNRCATVSGVIPERST